MLTEIQRALKAKNAEGVARAAHAFKGAAANFGSSDVIGAVKQLEAAGREGDMRRAKTAYTELENVLPTFLGALAAFGSPQSGMKRRTSGRRGRLR